MNASRSMMLINNWAYLLWFAFYYGLMLIIFGIFENGIIIVTVIFAISLLFAFSPLAEWILRYQNKFNPVLTEMDMQYVLPLFEEVYNHAKEKDPRLSRKINIYIVNSMDINAYAVGLHSIGITKGALSLLSEIDCSSLIAHEFGHMRNGDTKARLIGIIGTGAFYLLAWVGDRLLAGMEWIWKSITQFSFPFSLLRLLYNWIILITRYIGDIILLANGRGNEYRADEYACHIGYGFELASALYRLDQIPREETSSFKALITKTHPSLPERIYRIECFISEDSPMDNV